MTPSGSGQPAYLASEIGYAMWWLQNPRRGPSTGPAIIQRLLARGKVADANEARAALRQARANITAAARVQGSSGNVSLRAACGYKCPPDTPIALRIVVDVVDGRGQKVESRSIVVQGRADEKLGDVLHRARTLFNSRFRRGTAKPSGELKMTSDPLPSDVAQVLLNYTQGTVTP